MTIVCATDFSEPAEAAEAQALQLAKALGSDVVLLHVAVETPLYAEGPFSMGDVQRVYEAQREWATHTLAARVDAARAHGVGARALLRSGPAHREIVSAAEAEHADMIVMGTHGRSGLERLMLGSVAERVVRLATCPVMTVPPRDRAETRR